MSLALSLLLTVATAAEPGELATRLSAMRTEVEALSETLALERDELRGELRALEMRKAELEARIRQEEARVAELDRAVARQRELLASDAIADEALTPMLLTSIERIAAAITAGLPYRLDERRQELQTLAAQLEDRTLDPRRGLSRVWQLVEDELRLSRENTVDRQELTLSDGRYLVSVARLGMVGLFWRSDDGRYGMSARDGETWTWREVTDEVSMAQIDGLFDALRKQVRVGWHELPWLLPEVAP